MLRLCAFEHASNEHPGTHGYGRLDPWIHALQDSGKFQWIVQGMSNGKDPAFLMLRLSALISFTTLAGTERGKLSEQLRPWGYVHNFVNLIKGDSPDAPYYTYMAMGRAILKIAGGKMQPIFVHPDFDQAPGSDLFWADEEYWSGRINGESHDQIWERLHTKLSEKVGGTCGCRLGRR